MNREDLKAVKDWEEYYRLYITDDEPLPDEDSTARNKRVSKLEFDNAAWCKYYFKKYCTCEFAPFHLKAMDRLLKNERWYEVRAWARELAKSSITMMEVSKLALTGKVKNVLLISNSFDNAVDLLKPFKLNFEHNKRIIADYGVQKIDGEWADSNFTIAAGCSFRAIGAGQSPRGKKNENYRPDLILIDDIDTDEACRNPERVKELWKWVEQALLPAMSVSGKYRIIFLGNIIAKDSVIVRACKKARHVDIINIRDENGKSTWPAKNSEEDIDTFLNMLSSASIQKEFFNNPITEGEVFTEIKWGRLPPLSRFKFVVAYADPATSNKDKKGTCTKAIVLVGFLNANYYILKAKCRRAKNDEFIDWFFELRDWIAGRCPTYYYIENNSLQDPFYEQVFMPLIAKKIRARGSLGVTPDTKKKAEKATRIEAKLEPLNRTGKLIFNEAEKGDPDMERLAEQFLCFDMKLSTAVDGVDATEGAVDITDTKLNQLTPGKITVIPTKTNSKKY